jgi:hypothetical protein
VGELYQLFYVLVMKIDIWFILDFVEILKLHFKSVIGI